MILKLVLLISIFLGSSSVAKAAECKHVTSAGPRECNNNDECCSKTCLDGRCSPSQIEGTVCSKDHSQDCATATGYQCVDGKCQHDSTCTLFDGDCERSHECCSNICSQRKCQCAKTKGKPCDENEDCCKPLVCIKEECEPCKKSGSGCSKESECCSNKCNGGKCACSNKNDVCLSNNDCCKAGAGQLEIVCVNGKCKKCLVPDNISGQNENLEGDCGPGASKETCCSKKCFLNKFCTRLPDGANCEINGNCQFENCWKGKCAHVAYGLETNCFKENENCPDRASGKGSCCGKYYCKKETGKCTFRPNVSCDRPGVCNPGVDVHGNEQKDANMDFQQQSSIGR